MSLRNITKRFLSTALSATLVFAGLPTQALAEAAEVLEGAEPSIEVVELGEEEAADAEATLMDAVDEEVALVDELSPEDLAGEEAAEAADDEPLAIEAVDVEDSLVPEEEVEGPAADAAEAEDESTETFPIGPVRDANAALAVATEAEIAQAEAEAQAEIEAEAREAGEDALSAQVYNIDELKALIAHTIGSRSTALVNVVKYDIDYEDLIALYNEVKASHIDFFYTYGPGVNYNPSTGKALYFSVASDYGTSEIANMQAKVKAAFANMMQYVSDGATPAEKVKAIHDYLAYNVRYDTATAESGTEIGTAFDAYGALVNKKAVCQGYSDVFQAAMTALGIPATTIVANNHQWNRVYINGSWFQVDCTWDELESNPTRAYFFLKSDAGMIAQEKKWSTDYKKTGALTHTGFKTPAGMECTNTCYDDKADKDWPSFTAPAKTASVSSVSLDKTSETIKCAQSLQLTPTVSKGSGTAPYPTWTSSDPSVAYVTASGLVVSGNKSGTATITCTVGGKKATCKVTVGKNNKALLVDEIKDKTYTGSPITPSVKVTCGSKELTKGTDYTVSYDDNTNVGTATVKVVGKGTYAGSEVQASFRIVPIKLTGATVTFSSGPYVYDGKQKYVGSLKVVLGGKTLKGVVDYTTSYSNNVNAGTATLTISGRNNYQGSIKKTFKIEPTSLAKAKVTASDKTYTGKAVTSTPVVKFGTKKLVAGTDYTASYANNVDPGIAKVTVTGKGNYKGKASGTFIVAFKDVSKSKASHYYSDVHHAAAQGIVNGVGAGYFSPAANLTRGQVATMLWNLAGQPKPKAGAKNFKDVNSGAFYYQAVRWASSVKVVSGYSDTKFGPNDNVTHEQLCVMVANYARSIGGLKVTGSAKDYAKFKDAGKVASYARTSVGFCFKNKLTAGFDGMVAPQGKATRAETASMLYRLKLLIKK